MVWSGCGACGCVSQTCPRGGSGSRPRQLRGAAFNGWTRCGRKRRKPSGRPEVRPRTDKSPRWSAGRRDAPIARCVPRLASAELLLRRSALRSPYFGSKKKRQASPNLTKHGRAERWLASGPHPEGREAPSRRMGRGRQGLHGSRRGAAHRSSP